MASEALELLIWASATLSVGILLVLALRLPVRRFAGARVAYLLWLIPPLGYLAWLAPARQVIVTAPAMVVEIGGAPEAAAFDWAAAFVGCWLIGVAGMIAVFRFRQRRFEAAAGSLEPVAALGRNVFAAAPTHGPAVVGALRPVIVLPNDFASRYSAEEQALILMHERTHVERGDPLVNAAALALRAVHWFNPLVHIAMHALRIDQELACDATVVERRGGARRTYAEAMLKSHAAAFEVPVGCAWHSSAFHPMKERILMLKASPSRLSRHLGLSFVAVAALGVAGAVWLMRPVEVLAAPAREQATTEIDVEDQVDAVDEADAEDVVETKTDAQRARIEAWQAAQEARAARREAEAEAREAAHEAREAAHEARAALDEARREAAIEAREAVREARAAVAAARKAAAQEIKLAMDNARPAIAAAREAAKEAAKNVRPAIAEAQRALDAARPAIAAARRAAAEAAMEAARAAAASDWQSDADAWARTHARLTSACRHFLARSSEEKPAEEKQPPAKNRVCVPPAKSGPDAGKER